MPPEDPPEADDLVVRAALGEELTRREQARLDADPALQADVAEFAEIVRSARDAPPDDPTGRTLDRLWSGIAAETFEGATEEDDPDATGAGPRRGLWAGLVAVAAAAAVVGVLVTVGPLATEPPPVVAAADLAPLDGADGAAVQGRFVRDDDRSMLHLDLSGLPGRDDGFYEVWLLDAADGRLLSLGPARPDGTYVLPAGVGVDDFPTVDVSVEPRDGDPGHAGASVLRGPVRERA